jgi:proteasome accessory factor C
LPGSDRASTRRRPATAAERLGRLLVIVPYVVEHPGTRIGELARLFGVEEDALVEDLGVLFMSGLPPYSPGDLVDVDIQDGRVWIGMAEFFSRPLRLTRNEAVSLVLRGTALAGMPGVPHAEALASALAKLRERLGPDVLGPAAERVEAAADERAAGSLEELRGAANRSERVEIDYLSASGDASSRRIDPEEVFAALGRWYVAAWDARSDEERLFRVDRIKRLARTGERFEPRGLRGAGRPLYTPTERDVEIRLLLHPDARWVVEYHPVTSTVERADGTTEVTMPARGLTWAAKLVLRVAPQARVLDPPELADSVRALARATRERYV